MFFEFRVGSDVMLFNLAQVSRIKLGIPSGEFTTVTFFFTDGGQETVTITPTVMQRLATAIPRPTMYGSGGMG